MAFIAPELLKENTEPFRYRYKEEPRQHPRPTQRAPAREMKIPEYKHHWWDSIDPGLVLLVFITITLYAVCWLLLRRRKERIIFCERGHESEGCHPCPIDGICVGGHLRCRDGFIRMGDKCVTDVESRREIRDLGEKMKEKIEGRVRKDCNGSEMMSFGELYDVYGREEHFEEALDELGLLGIERRDGMYFSRNAKASFRCYIRDRFFESPGVFLFGGVIMVLTLVLVVNIWWRIRVKRDIRSSAERIIRSMNSSSRRRQQTFYAASFEPVEGNRMSRRWKEVMREVERHPSVIALESTNGRLWKFMD